ncbi:hypothetical protein [Streptomyces sp. CC208A]|uniref:hypothetical protein n=1 Tax=Streptomyces sp. CC208A TaxID=3044573 RepID=UPI0024A9F175|nr:hypothetical protein [Streptomyces sp. CC208A]
MAGAQSSQERIERLKALLTGKSSSRRAGAALASSGTYGNLLLGVALHGADRMREGTPPTPLELLFTGALLNVLGRETLEWGAAYRETVQSAAPGTLVVPEVIAARPSSSGFDYADLAEVLPHLSQEASQAPNLLLLTPEDLAAGRTQEDAAFIEAMRETGFAVTGVARHPGAGVRSQDSGTVQDAAPAAQSWRVKLQMENFYVQRAVGDQGGGRDEIYFTAAASVGDGRNQTFVSEEFGAVKQGQTRTFSSDKKVFLDQQSGSDLAIASIQVWEADQSNSQWYNSLQQALNSAVVTIDRVLSNPVATIVDPTPLPVTIAWEVTKVFVALMDTLRNNDDLSCSRTFVLTRDDMAILHHQPGLEWDFNGDGYHRLRVRYTGERPVYPTGSIEITSRDQGTEPSAAGAWSAPVPLGWKTGATPALASYRGHLYTVFPQAGDKRLVWSRYDGAAWTAPRIIGSAASDHPCALAVHKDQLHLMYTGGDSNLYHGWFNGQEWSPLQPVSNWKSALGPALVEMDGVLWSGHTGGDRAYIASWVQGTNWNTAELAGGPLDHNTVHSTPALGTTPGRITIDYRNANNRMATLSRRQPFDGGWSTMGLGASWSTRHAPTVHEAGRYGWMAYTGLDNRAYLGWRATHPESPSRHWANNPAEVIQRGTWTCTPLAAPALTAHNGRLYAIYHA